MIGMGCVSITGLWYRLVRRAILLLGAGLLVVCVILCLSVAGHGQAQRQGEGAQGNRSHGVHSSTRTSRIIPASMW